jgi:hypothetical protein
MQPVFWAFVGLCRDSGVKVFDAQCVELTETVQGGVNGLVAEIDRNARWLRACANYTLRVPRAIASPRCSTLKVSGGGTAMSSPPNQSSAS